MYVDKQLEFSSEQTVTSSAASTNVADLSQARDIGLSQKYLAITVDETVTADGAATVNFKIQQDGDSAFSDPTDKYDSGAIGKATLVAGYQMFIPLPLGIDERYIRVHYTVGTGPLTAGKFSAHIVDNIQSNKAYADAL
jgi:hypothetical protein